MRELEGLMLPDRTMAAVALSSGSYSWLMKCLSRSIGASIKICTLLSMTFIAACQTEEQRSKTITDNFFGNDHATCQMARVGELPVHERQGHLYIDGTIKNQHVSLIFDTGAQETVLTQDAADRLNLSRRPGGAGRITGLGGDQVAAEYRVHFLLDGVEGDWERYVLAGNIGHGSTTAFGDGLIGPSFFVGHDIDLDLPGERIILYFPDHDCSFPSVFLHGPLFKVPLAHQETATTDPVSSGKRRIASFVANLADASPRIVVSVGGKLLVASIDSGAPDNVLFLSGAQKIGITGDQIAKDKSAVAFGVGALPVPAVKHLIETTDVGDLEILNLPIVIVDQDFNGVDMVLGLDFLKRVHVWISYSSNSLVMQYPPGPSP